MNNKIALGIAGVALLVVGLFLGSHLAPGKQTPLSFGVNQTYPLHAVQNPTSLDQLFTWGVFENSGVSWFGGAINASSSLTLTGAATLNGNVAIAGTLSAATTTVVGHFITTGPTPTVAVGGAGYATGNVFTGSVDNDGAVSSSVATANSGLITVNFATPYTSAPFCLVSNASIATDTFFVSSSVSSFSINTPAGLIAGAHTWTWQCNQ